MTVQARGSEYRHHFPPHSAECTAISTAVCVEGGRGQLSQCTVYTAPRIRWWPVDCTWVQPLGTAVMYSRQAQGVFWVSTPHWLDLMDAIVWILAVCNVCQLSQPQSCLASRERFLLVDIWEVTMETVYSVAKLVWGSWMSLTHTVHLHPHPAPSRHTHTLTNTQTHMHTHTSVDCAGNPVPSNPKPLG